ISSRVSSASSGSDASAQVSESAESAETAELLASVPLEASFESSELRSMPKYPATKTTTAPPIMAGSDFLPRADCPDEESLDAGAMRTIVAAKGHRHEIRSA